VVVRILMFIGICN